MILAQRVMAAVLLVAAAVFAMLTAYKLVLGAAGPRDVFRIIELAGFIVVATAILRAHGRRIHRVGALFGVSLVSVGGILVAYTSESFVERAGPLLAVAGCLFWLYATEVRP